MTEKMALRILALQREKMFGRNIRREVTAQEVSEASRALGYSFGAIRTGRLPAAPQTEQSAA